jgi:putative nucleotidyltransferase with HDIG domain
LDTERVLLPNDELLREHEQLRLTNEQLRRENEQLRRALSESQRRAERKDVLVRTFALLSSTLDRQQLLTLIMEQARALLDAEATSIFTIDKASGDLVPHVVTGSSTDALLSVRVPKGCGIVGLVASTGERVLVNDAQRDPRHYSGADQETGFVTRSILAVPMRTQTIRLGGERGDVEQEIVGVAEALNKRGDAAFDHEDAELLATLASQAATVLQLAALFEDLNKLFFGVIGAVSAAVDARDPYTQGHSLRVADFATAMAREMGLDAELIHQIRIGGILHDIGKIGVPDAILNKPGRLTDEEFALMRKHPEIGERIMRNVPQLGDVIGQVMRALLEHHERLDGGGYPHGLRDDKISVIGRIIGVADVFDALTSGRPYREALPAEEALRILQAGQGREFDPDCVAALVAAREHGTILVQHERPDPNR